MTAEDGPAGRPRPATRLSLPRRPLRPLPALAVRVGLALFLVLVITGLVWVDRAGYADDAGGSVDLTDAFYYATVTITTTGYGDIAPITPRSRLVTALVVTPARVLFLVLLVGTTLELLTERWRETVRHTRWRARLRDHTIICGFGVKGASAARVLLGQGVAATRIVVVERDPDGMAEADRFGFAAIRGDATRVAVLEEAGIRAARAVVVAVNRDDTAVLVTLTARELSPRATIVASVRERENAHLLEQSGADSVISSAEASGRLLGLATGNPAIVRVVEDVLDVGEGLRLDERVVDDAEVGTHPGQLPGQLVLAVVRDGDLLRFDDPSCGPLRQGDRVVSVRSAPPP